MELYLTNMYLLDLGNLLLLYRLTVKDTDSFPQETEHTWVVGSGLHTHTQFFGWLHSVLIQSYFPTPLQSCECQFSSL